MFGIFRRFFGNDTSGKSLRMSQDFYDAGFNYLNLVKSRILESVVTPEKRIFPASASPQDKFILVVFLASYFSVRTDLELSKRDIPQPFRDEMWSHLIDAVFDDMNSGGGDTRAFKHLAVGQMELLRGIIVQNGAENTQAIADSLLVFLSSAKKINGEASKIATQEAIDKTIKTGVDTLLEYYDSYLSYLDEMQAIYKREKNT